MTVRAKFYVESVTKRVGAPNDDDGTHEVTLCPVIGGSDENKQFFKWTPYGEIKMGVVSAEVAATLAPGKTFYIDFIPADAATNQ